VHAFLARSSRAVAGAFAASPSTPGRRGSVQEFCSAACRCAFHAEARQLGQRQLGTRVQKTPPAFRDAYWRSGIDAATGRRIPVTVRPPWALAHSASMSVFDLLTESVTSRARSGSPLELLPPRARTIVTCSAPA